jgi:probable addiction module antidote protein
MKLQTRPFEELLNEELSQDPEVAAAYIQAAAEDGDPKVLARAIGDVVKAGGGVRQLAKTTGLNRPNLQNALSGKGNPSLSHVAAVLDQLGLVLTVRPKARAAG